MSVRPARHDAASGLVPGASFAGYRVEAVAGEGAIGVIYRATQLALGRPVALKLIAAEVAKDAAFRARLERETRLAASIRHPSIVPVYEIVGGDDRPVLAMRYVPGDLSTLIERDGALEAERAVRIVEQVAAALDAAHSRGLIHGDIKPRHVLLGDEPAEHASLTDFGVTGRGVSSFDYVAPEQIRGEQPGVRSDVYALGCVLFHALTGRPPFERRTNAGRIVAHLDCPPPVPSVARGDVPVALDAVIARALSKRPADRYASAGELARAAVGAVRGETPAAASAAIRGETAAAAAAARRGDAAAAAAVAMRGEAAVPGATGRSGTPLTRRAWLVGRAVLAAVLVGCSPAAALAAAGLIGGGDHTSQAAAPPRKQQVAPAPDARPATPTLVASIPVGKGADGIAVADGAVWVAASRENALVRVDARSARVTARVPAGVDPDSVAAGRGVVWVTSRGDGLLRRFTARAKPVAAGTIGVGDKPEGIALADKLAWVVSAADDTVTRVGRATAAAVGGPIGVGGQPIDVSVGPSGVWTTDSDDATVTHIDAATGTAIGDPVRVGREPKGVTEGLGSVWVANGADDTVTRIDPRTARAIGDPIHVGDQPSKLAIAAGLVWVTNFGDDTVSRIDPRTGRTVGTPIPVGRQPVGIAAGAGHIWVANLADGTVTKIRP
jgi:YVTN family beta-propeller protein